MRTATATATRSAGVLASLSLGELVDWAVLFGVTAVGLLHPQPALWYRSLLVGVASIAGPVLVGAGLVTFFCERAQQRIQGPRQKPALIALGVWHTFRAGWVAGALAAWPIAQGAAGYPTGLTWSLGDISVARLIVETFFALLVMDGWLYLKHRILHTRLFWPFHREHHVYRDPTAFSGFAVGPVESVLTFWPILLLCIPAARHFAPVYFGLVSGFVILNFYLHCGVRLRFIEATLPRLLVNTSAFHNVHHSHARVNFGEAFILWDVILKSRLADKPTTPPLADPAKV